jgi:hypothetical protein
MTPTAAAIWDRLGDWCTLEALIAHVVAHFEVERDIAEQDVREFLGQLETANALVARETPV